MAPRKKISLAREIFEKKEREERKFQRIPAKIFHWNISPEATKVMKKLLEEELKRNEKDEKIDRIKKFLGSMLFLLALFTATLGCIWLIKFFIKGIF